MNFLDRFSKKTRISNFTKIFSVGADRQTDKTNLTVAFRSFANAAKKIMKLKPEDAIAWFEP